jgi:hypothetical protein
MAYLFLLTAFLLGALVGNADAIVTPAPVCAPSAR